MRVNRFAPALRATAAFDLPARVAAGQLIGTKTGQLNGDAGTRITAGGLN